MTVVPDHRAKLEWGRRHFESLNDEINSYVASSPYKMAAKYDFLRSEYVAYFEKITPVPQDWSLRIGDCLHNLRSALDALAFALAVKHVGRSLTPQEERRVQFVITDDRDGWPNEARKSLTLLSDDAKQIIESVQPYQTFLQDRVCPPFDGPERVGYHTLSLIRDLSNTDKHRHVIVSLAVAAASAIVVKGEGFPPEGLTLAGSSGPLVEGGEIVCWTFLKRPRFRPQLELEGQLTVEVEAHAPNTDWRFPIVSILASAHRIILENIFPPLEALL